MPPALSLLLSALEVGGDWATIRKRVRTSLPDLREQSLFFESQNRSREQAGKPLAFDVHLHGALDLLGDDSCRDPRCRVVAADQLARSMGLLADRMWLTDHLSTKVILMGRATNAALGDLMLDAVVLARLLPLIQARIIRFRSPWISTCAECTASFESQIEISASNLLRTFQRDFKVETRRHGGYFSKTGVAFEPPIVLHSTNPSVRTIPTNREFAEQVVASQTRSVLWTAREAALTGGSVFTNSRIGLAALLEREGRLPDRKSPLLFDTSDDLLAELREQAAEVRAELEVKRVKSARYWKTTYGLLGLGLSAYGVITDQILPGVGGLLHVLQLLINHKTGHEGDVAKLTSRPNYVLVKAQDILAHSH